MYSGIIIFLICLFFIIVKSYRNYKLLIILIFSLLFKTTLAYIHQFIRPLGASCDELKFEEEAWHLAQKGLLGLFNNTYTESVSGFSWLSAVFYNLFGREPFVIQSLNVFAGVFTIYYVYRISFLFVPCKKNSIIISSCIAMLPSLSIITSLFLRDSILIFLITFSFYKYFEWQKYESQKSFLINLFTLIVSSLLHGAMFLFIGIELLFEAYRITKYPNLTFLKKLFFYLMMGTIIVIALLYIDKISNNPKIEMALNLLNNDTSLLNRLGGEIIKSDAFIEKYPTPPGSDIASLIIHTPYRIFYFLTTPWPNMYSKITDIPRILDSFFVMALMLIFLTKSKKFFKFQFSLSFFVLFSFIVCMFAFGSFDVLTGQRHRLKIIPVLTAMVLSFVIPSRRTV